MYVKLSAQNYNPLVNLIREGFCCLKLLLFKVNYVLRGADLLVGGWCRASKLSAIYANLALEFGNKVLRKGVNLIWDYLDFITECVDGDHTQSLVLLYIWLEYHKFCTWL